jgi:hypothetical protein
LRYVKKNIRERHPSFNRSDFHSGKLLFHKLTSLGGYFPYVCKMMVNGT